MRAGGFRSKRLACRPHLTLLYDRYRTLAFRVLPLSWTVKNFVLIRSVPPQTGRNPRPLALGRPEIVQPRKPALW
ncbi:hypothetical protein AB4Z10_10845 [Bosea sp. RAF48]|uniref:hypothetical protein n=1 Tax=Bosea sp. RAF48 TaxID=3237480 RepID=UPI003F9351D7